MDKTYQPNAIEAKWYAHWESHHYFTAKPSEPAYCIMLPPPNVTGQLHMGHAFQDALMDTLIRMKRMQGYQTLWQMGVDHAGIATQMVVERQLAQKNLSRHALGREAFIEKVWEWKKESGDHISQQMRRLGTSGDWTRSRFTLDDGLSTAVQQVFIKLHQEGLIYRGKRLVNWDPQLLTALSDLEVISEEEQGHLWTLRYPIKDSTMSIEVATTRPETLLGDVAVAVHPADPRYQHLIGQFALLPLTDRAIPIIADEFVEPEFGTGCVKITPAHDFNDYAVGIRHQLPLINLFTETGYLNENAPKQYQGLERFAARKQIVADLEQQGFLVKIDPHTLKVPRGDRSGVIVEPRLTDQWYVKVAPLAEPAIQAVKNESIQFIPKNWENTYFEWMNNIQDWCISRQLWWGHRIPAWYDTAGNCYVGENEQAIRQANNLAPDVSLTQDEDVLDTWFSSALWPFSTLGWPEQTPELKTFYPTNVLVTGFDIIFFWVARMIMFGLKFTGQVPFHTVYVHGLIQDAEGQKMSKSKGNVLDPIDLIDGISLADLLQKRTSNLMQPHLKDSITKATKKQFPEGISAYGTDALRFTFCALASTGRHIRFDNERLEGYHFFCNKLWNAARYVLMQTEDYVCSPADKPQALADQWILSQLHRTTQTTLQHFEQYRFDLAAKTLYDFTWNIFCDWYLELSKPVLYAENVDPIVARGTRYTLLTVLETLVRLLHPIMPFITEEIWQQLKPSQICSGDSIMMAAYPQVDAQLIQEEAEQSITWLQQLILAIRQIRGEMNISPAQPLRVQLKNGAPLDEQRLNAHKPLLMNLAKLEDIDWYSSAEPETLSASALAGHLTVTVPLKGLIDVEAEISRLQKTIQKFEQDLNRCQQKLNNPDYCKKAPADVVQKEQEKCTQLRDSINKLLSQCEQLKKL